MTRDKRLVQLTLIFIGIFLILATYFLYPSISKKQVEKKRIKDEKRKKTLEENSRKEEEKRIQAEKEAEKKRIEEERKL